MFDQNGLPYLFALPGQDHSTVPLGRHVQIQDDTRRQTLFENLVRKNGGKVRGCRVIDAFAVLDRYGNRWNPLQSTFKRGRKRPRIQHAIAHVSSTVNSRYKQIGIRLQDPQTGQNHAVGRGSVDCKAVWAVPVIPEGTIEGDRVTRRAHLALRRNNCRTPQVAQGTIQLTQCR